MNGVVVERTDKPGNDNRWVNFSIKKNGYKVVRFKIGEKIK